MEIFYDHKCEFEVTLTDFPLGKGVLPDYIKQKRSIVSMEVDSHNKLYKDNHCFFRCSAYQNFRAKNRGISRYARFGKVFPSKLAHVRTTTR